MITKNGSIVWGKGRLGGASIADTDMKTFQGDNRGDVVERNINYITAISSYPQYYSLAIGNGTNEPQKSDYNMAEITNQYVFKDEIYVNITPDGAVIFTRSYTNIVEDTITITELGLYLVVEGYVFLVARKLIPPRTLAPGETATFSYKIAFN